MKNSKILLLVSAISILVAGCGDDGGDNSLNPNGIFPQNQLLQQAPGVNPITGQPITADSVTIQQVWKIDSTGRYRAALFLNYTGYNAALGNYPTGGNP